MEFMGWGAWRVKYPRAVPLVFTGSCEEKGQRLVTTSPVLFRDVGSEDIRFTFFSPTISGNLNWDFTSQEKVGKGEMGFTSQAKQTQRPNLPLCVQVL